MSREDVWFTSGGERIAAWWYPAAGRADGERGTCVVMANGFSMTRHDGLPAYAQALSDAGAGVLVFDHRFLGDSGGAPRQRFRAGEQLEDWRNALAYVRGRDDVDPARVVAWGFSFSGGHVTKLLQRDHGLAAGLLVCPFVDGPRRVLSAGPGDIAWLLPRALADLAGRHTTIPVTAQPGSRAAMTLPGEADGFARAVPAGSPWRNEISPGLFATVALHAPWITAARIRVPVWIALGERDVSAPAAGIEALARRAPHAELHRYDHDHFDPFVGEEPARLAAAQIAFLRQRSLLH